MQKNVTTLEISPTEKQLRAAHQRLVSSTPTNPELAAKAKSGTLRINPTTVALEAGLSRTLISHAGCQYLEVRNEILKAKPASRTDPTTMAQVNRNLRQDIADALKAKRIAEELMAAMVLRMNKVEVDAKRRIEAELRKVANGGVNPNQIAGSRIGDSSGSAHIAIVGGTDIKK